MEWPEARGWIPTRPAAAKEQAEENPAWTPIEADRNAGSSAAI